MDSNESGHSESELYYLEEETLNQMAPIINQSKTLFPLEFQSSFTILLILVANMFEKNNNNNTKKTH